VYYPKSSGLEQFLGPDLLAGAGVARRTDVVAVLAFDPDGAAHGRQIQTTFEVRLLDLTDAIDESARSTENVCFGNRRNSLRLSVQNQANFLAHHSPYDFRTTF
jgi:hypothetical protein